MHASWLNQVEILFSVVQRKVLTPNDFADLDEVQARLLAFQTRYEASATPFEWKFTRHDLDLSTPAATPFSNNIEGVGYLRPEFTRRDVFWRSQSEAVVYALLFGGVAAWLLF